MDSVSSHDDDYSGGGKQFYIDGNKRVASDISIIRISVGLNINRDLVIVLRVLVDYQVKIFDFNDNHV